MGALFGSVISTNSAALVPSLEDLFPELSVPYELRTYRIYMHVRINIAGHMISVDQSGEPRNTQYNFGNKLLKHYDHLPSAFRSWLGVQAIYCEMYITCLQ